MFTLFQIMTFDSWSGIVRVVIFPVPTSLIIFSIFIGLGSIVLMNLITAIVVENAFAAAAADAEAVHHMQEEKKNAVTAQLLVMFQDLDEDQSGFLTKEEFTDVLDDPVFIQKMKTLDLELEDLPDLFDMFD